MRLKLFQGRATDGKGYLEITMIVFYGFQQHLVGRQIAIIAHLI
jgi:hypothetical protein